jgi:hypothetical protein
VYRGSLTAAKNLFTIVFKACPLWCNHVAFIYTDGTRNNKIMEPEDQHRVHVYLINQYNEVLLRKIPATKTALTTRDITIESQNIPSVLTEIEKQWGVLCSDDEFSHLYTILDHGATLHGYVIVMRLDPELISFLTSHLDWKFYSFTEIRSHLLPHLSPETFKLVERLVAEI